MTLALYGITTMDNEYGVLQSQQSCAPYAACNNPIPHQSSFSERELGWIERTAMD